ncbi:MAG: hypothetical protein IPM94_14240 [bacterium]|nr:hypothetical protein [bacterium]
MTHRTAALVAAPALLLALLGAATARAADFVLAPNAGSTVGFESKAPLGILPRRDPRRRRPHPRTWTISPATSR